VVFFPGGVGGGGVEGGWGGGGGGGGLGGYLGHHLELGDQLNQRADMLHVGLVVPITV